MSEDKKEKPAEATEAAAPSGGGSKLPIILGFLNLVLVVGIGAIVFLQFQKDKHREAVSDIKPESSEKAPEAGGEHGEKKEEGHGEAAHGEGHGEHGGEAKPAGNDKLLTLDQFTINLSTSPNTPTRFARVTVAVEMSSSEASAELTSKMAPVRNAIIDLFNSKRPSDLQTGEARNFLKEEIKNALNSFLVTGKVKGVFFSAFQVSN